VERGRVTNYERELVAAEVRAEENTRLQRGLLPSPLIQTQALRFAPFYRPGRERALLGGDFYDVVQTDSGVHLLIGDVSGHGLDEAALGVALRIAWRALVLAGLSPSEVVLGVEQVLLAERGDEERFASAAMLSLDPGLNSASLTLCGHPAPLLIAGGGVVELDADPAPALGIVPGTCPTATAQRLEGDWGLLLFTDGLIEGSESPGAADRYGSDKLAAHVRVLLAEHTAPPKLAPALLTEAERHHGGPLPDDVAVLTVGTRGWWD
jgi:serine phosphatase RsbU (regulator of sigma subunit)